VTAKRKLEVEVSAELAEELDALVARGVEESLSEFVEASLWDALLPLPLDDEFPDQAAARAHLRGLIQRTFEDSRPMLSDVEAAAELERRRRERTGRA